MEDLKEMGLPLGPRKKVSKFVKERVNKQVGVASEGRCGAGEPEAGLTLSSFHRPPAKRPAS